MSQWDIRQRLQRIEDAVNQLLALVSGAGVPDDLKVLVKGSTMQNLPHIKMGPKTHKKGATGQPIVLTGNGPLSLTVDPIDANGKDVPITDIGNLVGSLTVDAPKAFVISPGGDTLHFTAIVPAGTPSTTVMVTGGLHANDNSFPDLSASQQITTPVIPPPSDLKIVVNIGP